MSAWCPRDTVKNAGSTPPSTNTGATIVTSGRCVPLRYGSLRMITSPRLNGPSPNTCLAAAGIEPRCSGMCGAIATIRPRPSNTPQE